MQIILTLEPIEIVVDDLAEADVNPGRLALAAHDGIAEYLQAHVTYHGGTPRLTVRPFIPPTTGVVSCEINPF